MVKTFLELFGGISLTHPQFCNCPLVVISDLTMNWPQINELAINKMRTRVKAIVTCILINFGFYWPEKWKRKWI